MQIAVSGKFSNEHFDSAGATTAVIRNLLRIPEIKAIDTNLDGFVFFPVIVSNELGIEKKMHRSYSRKENAEFVSEEIDVGAWVASDEQGKLLLMIGAFEKAIRDTRASRIDDPAKEAITACIRRAASAKVH